MFPKNPCITGNLPNPYCHWDEVGILGDEAYEKLGGGEDLKKDLGMLATFLFHFPIAVRNSFTK